MSKLIEINFAPDQRVLRQFGIAAFFAFGILGLLAWSERGVFGFGLGQARLTVTALLFAIAGVTLLLGWLHPAGNRWLYVGLSLLTFPLGFVLSYLVLGFVFFGVITPIGVLLRAIARDPVERGLRRGAESYWTTARKPRPNDDYFSQF